MVLMVIFYLRGSINKLDSSVCDVQNDDGTFAVIFRFLKNITDQCVNLRTNTTTFEEIEST